MTFRVAAHQPGYHRSLSYFAKRLQCDVFVSLDDVQFNRRDWQHRQRFLVDGRLTWLSVPVDRGREALCRKRIVDRSELDRHWRLLRHVYARAPHLPRYEAELAGIYAAGHETLEQLCDAFDGFVCDRLGIGTPVLRSSALAHDPAARKGRLLAQLTRRAAVASGRSAGDDLQYVVCPNRIRGGHYLNDLSAADPHLTERDWLERAGVTPVPYPYTAFGYPRGGGPRWPADADPPAIDLLLHHGPDGRALLDRMIGPPGGDPR